MSNNPSREELNKQRHELENSWHFETRSILKSQAPDPATGATIFPIYQTSTYTQEGIGDHKGYIYSRTGNPTRTACAEVLASLEGGTHAFLYPSGIAAIHAVMQQLKPGDHVVSSSDLYGGAHRLFDQIISPLGLEFDYVDAREVSNVTAAIKDNTRMVWLESPTNPLMRLCDIKAICDEVKKINESRNAKSLDERILVGFDNTFASPYLQRPFEHGADIVVHSGTKYLGGHSDVLIGAVVVNDGDQKKNVFETLVGANGLASSTLAERFAYTQNATGNLAGPFDCWILMKGMKTLAVRMKEHHKNCVEVAHALEIHPKVKAIYCPVLDSNPQHELYKRQMDMYNGMLSFEYDGDYETVKQVVMKTKLFQLAESLGGVESLIGHPASMTHAAVPRERRIELGINDNLIRLSIGIENIEDIIADLKQALA